MSAPFSLGDYAYAHRGLWHPDGPPENSMAAFKAAAEAGLGIEFDVRLTADGTPVCFHDSSLARMAGVEQDLASLSLAEAQEARLLASDETIPTLDDLLAIWPHHLPLLVEMKATDIDPIPVAEAVTARLLGYEGRAAAMSFNPKAVGFIPKTLPRGLLIDRLEKIGAASFEMTLESALDPLEVDYISVWHEDAAQAAPFARAHGLGIVVWTVKTPEASAALSSDCDAQIFEGFDPSLVGRPEARYR